MRVLLVYPSSRREIIGYGDLGAIAEPLALEYLAAGARLDGHDVRLLDLRLHADRLDAALRTWRPDLVGLTGYSMHVLRMLEICRTVRRILPHCKTAVGGHHATLLPEDFFAPEVDYVFCGEGVKAFREVLRCCGEGLLAAPIPGLWRRNGDEGRFVSGGPAVSANLDDLPPPDRTIVPNDRPSYFIDWMRPIALMRTSVGCPYRCSFCSLWKIMDGQYHMRDVHRVVKELLDIAEHYVFFVDDEPFVNGKRMEALARAIRAAGIEKRYFAYCRIDTCLRQPALMRLWRDVGLERLFIGLEAITADGLEEYNKRLQLSQIEEGLRLTRDLGISVFAGFVVHTNYTREDFARLAQFIEEHRIEYPSFTVLTPIPGTAALTTFDDVLERLPSGRPNWDLFDLQHPVTRTTLPREEFLQEYKNLFRVFSPRYIEQRSEMAQLPW